MQALSYPLSRNRGVSQGLSQWVMEHTLFQWRTAQYHQPVTPEELRFNRWSGLSGKLWSRPSGGWQASSSVATGKRSVWVRWSLAVAGSIICIVVVQSLSCVQLFVTPWTAAYQAFLSFTTSRSLLKFMSIESVMPSSRLILCCPPCPGVLYWYKSLMVQASDCRQRYTPRINLVVRGLSGPYGDLNLRFQSF